jgi:hypothetical protein
MIIIITKRRTKRNQQSASLPQRPRKYLNFDELQIADNRSYAIREREQRTKEKATTTF